MFINTDSNLSFAYSAIKANSVTSQVKLSGDPEAIAEAAPANQNDRSANIAGKLNSLEHAATTNTRPMFLKGVLQKVTDIKVRDIDIDQMDFSRSNVALAATQITISNETGDQTYEQMHLDGSDMSLAVQGTFQTKSGAELGFELQLSSIKVSAVYAALSYQINASSETSALEPFNSIA